MKKIILLGSDPELTARMRVLFEGMAEIAELDDNDPDHLRVVVRNGVLTIEGDPDSFTVEEIEEAKREFEKREAIRKGLLVLSGNHHPHIEMCEQECDWACDEIAYNTSQANMMRRRDQHRAIVKWQHVRPVKARKPRRNSVRGRR